LLPCFFAFWYRDTGKSMAVPMMLFFLMIFWMNGDKARLVSQILPMGQLRLTALQQDALPAARFVLTDCIWIFLLSMGAYGGFRRADLK
ncbi:MAG: ABC transporter permease, partial [Blautia massiliensis (ex Durand et al. 2017)]